MPFPKLRLKKSKQQYNVASKAMYVITVELLDNNQLECTLTAESTGKTIFFYLKLKWSKSSLIGKQKIGGGIFFCILI